MADTFISSRRLNMYLSEKKHIDDTIFEYFKDIDNRQDVVKMILYDYIKQQDGENEFDTKKKQKSEGVVKKITPKKPKKVTNKSQENNKKDTEITPIGENLVTKNIQESNDFNFDDLITEEEVIEEKNNDNGFDVRACLKSMEKYKK